jgi:response regulator RpfG family c-di-GMP phosphodiesterase
MRDHYRLLHVEDDPIDRRLFGMMVDELRLPGDGVRHVARLEAALEALSSASFDVVFLDLDLPDSGGLATLERVLATVADVAVVVLTGTDDEQLGVEAVALGAQDYLVKGTVHAAALGRVLRYAVGRQRALATAKRASARAAAAEARFEASEAARAELSREAEERRQAQGRLEASLAQLQSLRDVDAAIIAGQPLPELLDTILAAALPLLPVEAAAFSLLEDGALVVVAQHGFEGGVEASCGPLAPDDAAARAAWSQGHVAFSLGSGDADAEFGRRALLAALGLRQYHALALRARQEPLGLLELFGRERTGALRPAWLEFAETHCAQAAAAIDALRLRSRLAAATDEVLRAYDTTILGWSRALDLRNREPTGHGSRVTEMALRLARASGMDAETLGHLRRGALLHDIGTMAVPDAILQKPGPLTPHERAVMERHAEFGRDLLDSIRYLRPAVDIPYAHHERWDGSGYPRGLAGERIPIAARIFAVVDVYDALTSARPHRAGWRRAQARRHLAKGAGRHFDPAVVESFLAL